jgi:hypothetical protein
MAYTRYVVNQSLGWAAGTYGTPVAAANHPVFDLSTNPMVSKTIAHGEMIGAYFPSPSRKGGSWSEIKFKSLLYGQTGDVPSEIGALLRACGFYESGTTLFTYTLGNPHLAGTLPTTLTMACADPIDLTWNLDSLQYIALNCVGRAVIHFEAGEIPYVEFDFRGQVATSYYTETAAALSLTMGATPVASGAATLTVTTNTGAAYSPVVRSLVIDTGATIDSREDLNGAGGFSQPIITRFSPTATLALEADLLASYDMSAVWRNYSKQTIAWVHNPGAATGQVITGSFEGEVSEDPSHSEVNGKLMVTGKLMQYAGETLPSMVWS